MSGILLMFSLLSLRFFVGKGKGVGGVCVLFFFFASSLVLSVCGLWAVSRAGVHQIWAYERNAACCC